jgi:hypothetical protein
MCAALYAVQFAMFRTTDDQDAGMHALLSRFPTPAWRLLTAFARPLFATVYLVPAQFGYPAMRAFTLVLCLATAWLTGAALTIWAAWLLEPSSRS